MKRQYPPSFCTGRHIYMAAFFYVVSIFLVLGTTRSSIVGTFWGSEDLRFIRVSEIVGVCGVISVGICLLPGMSSFEVGRPRSLMRGYVVATVAAGILPIVASMVLGIALIFRVYPQWEDFQDGGDFGFGQLLPHGVLPQTINAVFIGAIALLLLRMYGILSAVVGTVFLYVLVLWISAQTWESVGPYAIAGYGITPQARTLWAIAALIVAAICWAWKTGKEQVPLTRSVRHMITR